MYHKHNVYHNDSWGKGVNAHRGCLFSDLVPLPTPSPPFPSPPLPPWDGRGSAPLSGPAAASPPVSPSAASHAAAAAPSFAPLAVRPPLPLSPSAPPPPPPLLSCHIFHNNYVHSNSFFCLLLQSIRVPSSPPRTTVLHHVILYNFMRVLRHLPCLLRFPLFPFLLEAPQFLPLLLAKLPRARSSL